MPDDTYESDDDEQEISPRDLRKQLSDRAREAEEAKQQVEQMKRDLEFTKALGENANAPWTPYFQAGYKGDLDAESIKKAAIEAGFLSQSTPQQQGQPDDLNAHGRMAANAAGGVGGNRTGWQEALAEAGRIQNQADRSAAILDVVESYGGATSRQAQ